METNHDQRFGKIHMVEDYSWNISVKLLSNICRHTEINAIFHFSIISMLETTSVAIKHTGNSNEKNKLCRDRMSLIRMQIFSLITFMASEKKFFNIFLHNLTFLLQWQRIKITEFVKLHMVSRGLLKECKIEINANLHFPITSLWKNLSCHSIETTWETIIRNIMKRLML